MQRAALVFGLALTLLPGVARAVWLCDEAVCDATDELGRYWDIDPASGALIGLEGTANGMLGLAVDGTPFIADSWSLSDSGLELSIGPISRDGLTLWRHYRLIPGTSTLRAVVEVINTATIAEAVFIDFGGAHRLGPDVTVAATFSGDRRVSPDDAWLHLDDANPDEVGLLDLVLGLDDVGGQPVSVADVDLHPGGQLGWSYALAVPGGARVALMTMVGLEPDDLGALFRISWFYSTPAASFASGIPGGPVVLNWLVDDDDNDGFADALSYGDDCDDSSPSRYPGAPEICNSRDDDCDGLVDEEVSLTFYRDTDLDGFGTSDATSNRCSAVPGWADNALDCDDSNDQISPAGFEVCDGVDNDCNGQVDDGFSQDNDGDGVIAEGCGGTDCDDTDSSVGPGAEERCDGIDNDCDGTVDVIDADEDGFGDVQCGGADCNDRAEQIFPGAREQCNGWDDDCDGQLDDVDEDRDGAISAACAGGLDCDDFDAAIGPQANEVCSDWIDNDCDGLVDGADESCLGGGCAQLPFGAPPAGLSGWLLLGWAALGWRRRTG